MAKVNVGELTCYDLFTNGFINNLYSEFEAHINRDSWEGEDFEQTVWSEILVGLEEENTKKIISNLGGDFDKCDIVLFLHSHCFNFWYANMDGKREFTYAEKFALAAWGIFCTQGYESGQTVQTIHKFISDIKVSKEFIESSFIINMENIRKQHKGFLKELEGKII